MNIIEKAYKVIDKYFPEGSDRRYYLLEHSLAVANASKKIANNCSNLDVDIDLLYASALLHDIGICKTNSPNLGCFGDAPYLSHGFLGREILKSEGLENIAPVCERHIGVGISSEEIISNNLALPHRDMQPQTIEEEIVCYADKFFSKSQKKLDKPKSLDRIEKSLSKYTKSHWQKFELMMEKFGWEYLYD